MLFESILHVFFTQVSVWNYCWIHIELNKFPYDKHVGDCTFWSVLLGIFDSTTGGVDCASDVGSS